MALISEELDKTYDSIVNKMEFDKVYSIVNKEQEEKLDYLFETDAIPYCEFLANKTKFRKCKAVFELLFKQ